MERTNYDIFISYKRKKSLPTANNLYYRLTTRGYSTFFDLEEMGRGEFNTKLLKYIENAKDVFVILEEGSLKACEDKDWEKDWFCHEIAFALEKKKNIIPILLNGYTMPSEDFLPEKMRELSLKNALEFSFTYFNDYLDKLEKDYLLSKPTLQDKCTSVFKFYSNEDCQVFKEGKLVCSLKGMSDEPYYLFVPRKGDYRFKGVNESTAETKVIKEHIEADEEKEIEIEWNEQIKIRKEEEAKRKTEARRKAKEGAKRKAEEEAKRKEEARRKAEEEAKRKEEARRKAEEEAKRKEEARRKAEEEAKRMEEARRKAEEEAKHKEEARRKTEVEAKRKEEARRKAEVEAKRMEEARRNEEQRKREEEARKAAEEKKNKRMKELEDFMGWYALLSPPIFLGVGIWAGIKYNSFWLGAEILFVFGWFWYWSCFGLAAWTDGKKEATHCFIAMALLSIIIAIGIHSGIYLSSWWEGAGIGFVLLIADIIYFAKNIDSNKDEKMNNKEVWEKNISHSSAISAKMKNGRIG